MMAGATTHPFSTTTTSTHDWQFPPLPDEVLLHIFDYLDLQATMAVMRVSTHWHELANDPRVWKRLCCEQGFPKVDRRRFGCDWKRWYRCMVGRIKVHAFLGDYVGRPRRNEYSPITVLVEPDATVLTLVRVIACSSMVPPHKIRLWRIDDFEGDKLVLLQDPTQRLCDAGITSETADVLFELPDARNGYLRRLQPAAATSSSGGPTHVPTNPPQDRIQLDDILRETELLTRFWNDHLSLHDARVYFGNHAAAAAAPMDADDDDDDEQLQRVLAVSMFEMERRND